MQMAYRCDYQALPENCTSTSPPKVRTLVIERLESNRVYWTFLPKVREDRRPNSRKRRRSSQAREVMKRQKRPDHFELGVVSET